jgi:ABC-type transporter Mla subunit MlaD
LKLRGGFQSTTDSNLAKLQQIGIIFDQRLDSLKAGADDASTILRSSSDHLKSRVEDIETAANSASDKMRSISSTLADQSADIHLTTDQALLKVESVQKAVSDQFHDLAESVGRAVAQLQDAGDEFSRQSKALEFSTEGAASGFARAGMVAREEGDRLNLAAEQSADRTRELVASVRSEADQLLARAGETLTELRKAGDSFSIRAREVAEQMKTALNTSENYGRQLKSQAFMVADASAESAERLAKAVTILIGQVQNIGSAANDVEAQVETTRQSLSKESERLLTVSTAALEASRDAASTFGRQSESLFKASQDAAHHVAEIRKSELRSQREAFLGSAKFIIESLHSLSVDLTRMTEGEISEKTWKAFQKGDIAAFTRRLVEMRDILPLDRARTKFAKDTEFRTYVQRFIRQFEEIYDQAVESDHGSILAATLGSSEVGKLYDFLCAVAGRDSKLTRTPLKAA